MPSKGTCLEGANLKRRPPNIVYIILVNTPYLDNSVRERRLFLEEI